MAKNRKYQPAAIRFGPVIKAFLLCLLIGGSGVGYVWQKSQIDELGRQIAQRENRLRALREQNKKLKDQLAMLRSPANIEQRVRELNLGLGQPQPAQIWRVIEPPMPASVPAPPAPAPVRQLAAQSNRAPLAP
jgi:cell division protein FtsB